MSIASEMRKIADSKQPELTFEDKHKVLATIEQEAKQGNYSVRIEVQKAEQLYTYLTGVGFRCGLISTLEDGNGKPVANIIEIDWGVHHG